MTGDAAGACTKLTELVTTANGQLTQAQLNVLVPAVNAVRQPVGC